MDQPSYLDFDLLIERAGDSFRARVLDSPGGQGVHNFQLPFDDRDLKIFSLSILGTGARVRRVDDPAMKEVRELGTNLFQAVFDEEVLTCLDRSLYEADRQQTSLRLQLRIDDDPTSEGVSLSAIPWEFLFDRRSGGSFLAVSENATVVRFPSVPRPVEPLLLTPPLRLLAVISSPRGFAELDVEAEWRNLNEALDELKAQQKIVLERLEPPTSEALQRQLRRGRYHVFHFIGHGAFDEARDEGVLLFETPERKPDPVTAEELRELLGREPTLRLAVLNACEGARTSKEDPSAGVAQSLVQGGLPAVIAMQMPITDKSAIVLSREFYGSLADGYPVDAALAEARAAIKMRVSAVEWGVPVLYMRSRDGSLFAIGSTTPETVQEPAPVLPEQPDRGEVARQETERLAREQAEREQAERLGREQKEREQEEREQAEREQAERLAREQAEREAAALSLERVPDDRGRHQEPEPRPSRVPKLALILVAIVLVAGLISLAIGAVTRSPSSTGTRSANPTTGEPSPPTLAKVAGESIVEASASTTVPSANGLTYGIENTLDDDLKTAWNGDLDSGVGAELQYRFASPIALGKIEIINGYVKSNEVFHRNARIREALIETDSESLTVVLKDNKSVQSIELGGGTTSSVVITILSIYEPESINGKPPFTDIGVTEIDFYQFESG